MGELSGKVAVVTGAGDGIGGAVAQAFTHASATVVGIDREQADLTRAGEVACARRDRADRRS
jgi:NAD(P)-dependent dehydrogenase (short-subunit alcohol dehydrogenase family)